MHDRGGRSVPYQPTYACRASSSQHHFWICQSVARILRVGPGAHGTHNDVNAVYPRQLHCANWQTMLTTCSCLMSVPALLYTLACTYAQALQLTIE